MTKEHDKHLRLVLQCLWEHKLWEIVEIISTIHCLWYVISREGIVVHPMMLEDIMEWHVLKNILGVCNILVLEGYYQRFVEGFSKIANSIMELQEEKQEVCMD
jgi:hypothetical protein